MSVISFLQELVKASSPVLWFGFIMVIKYRKTLLVLFLVSKSSMIKQILDLVINHDWVKRSIKIFDADNDKT